MFDNLFKMFEKEHETQRDKFISISDKNSYWEKLKNKAEFSVHISQSEPAGFVAFYCNDEVTRESFITLILVSPESHGKKIGSALVDYVLNVSKLRGFSTCSLEVSKANKSAISFYNSKGFSISSEKDQSYIMRNIIS